MSRGFLSEPDYNHKPYNYDDEALLANYSDEQCCLNCRYFKKSRRYPGDLFGYKGKTKTGKVRVVSLEDESAELIREIWERQEHIRYADCRINPEGFLFMENGFLIDPDRYRNMFAERMERVGRVSAPHSLRNTFACNVYAKDGKHDFQAVMTQLGVTGQTALIYLTENEEGKVLVAEAAEKWIYACREESGMESEKDAILWDLYSEEPSIEVRGNSVTLSAAGVGFLGHLPYIRLEMDEPGKSIVLKGTTVPVRALPLEGHMVPRKDDKYAYVASWYVPQLGDRLDAVLENRYDLGKGVRFAGQYVPDARMLVFDAAHAVQIEEAIVSGDQPEKKKRGRRKKENGNIHPSD